MLRYEFLSPDRHLGSRFDAVGSFLDNVHGWRVGWHYAVDLAWLYEQICTWPQPGHVLDAGGGVGPAQYLLLELGFDVTSIDIHPLPPTPLERLRYRATHHRLASYKATAYLEHLYGRNGKRVQLLVTGGFGRLLREIAWPVARDVRHRIRVGKFSRQRATWRKGLGIADRPIGRLTRITGDLAAMPEIESSHFDGVVSLSSLEHIPTTALTDALGEIHRVVKPSGSWAITTSATEQDKSWYHEPSRAMNFCEQEVADMFNATRTRDCGDPTATLAEYQACTFLKERLNQAYFRSGKNGMPYGIWQPSYIPVGIRSTHADRAMSSP